MLFFISLSLSANKEYVSEMESVEGSLKQMGENVSAVQAAAVPGLAKWGQDKLDECQGRWDTLSKQVRKNFSLFALRWPYVLQFMCERNTASYFVCMSACVHSYN